MLIVSFQLSVNIVLCFSGGARRQAVAWLWSARCDSVPVYLYIGSSSRILPAFGSHCLGLFWIHVAAGGNPVAIVGFWLGRSVPVLGIRPLQFQGFLLPCRVPWGVMLACFLSRILVLVCRFSISLRFFRWQLQALCEPAVIAFRSEARLIRWLWLGSGRIMIFAMWFTVQIFRALPFLRGPALHVVHVVHGDWFRCYAVGLGILSLVKSGAAYMLPPRSTCSCGAPRLLLLLTSVREWWCTFAYLTALCVFTFGTTAPALASVICLLLRLGFWGRFSMVGV